MADRLLDFEILDVWYRIKPYVDWKSINATDPMNQKEQLRRVMERPSSRSDKLPMNMQTLLDNDFPEAFVENPKIRNELLKNSISSTSVRGKTRYQIKKGARISNVRAGQFLGGRNEEEAVANLKFKMESNKKISKGVGDEDDLL